MSTDADRAPSTDLPPTDRSTDAPPEGARASITFLVIVAALSAAADLGTKAWAHATLAGFDHKRSAVKTITVIPGYVEFVFAQNPGGAWSFLRSLPDGLRRPFFLFVAAAAMVFIVSIYRKLHRDQTAMKWGLALSLGGAAGNLADRIRYGWVIDFIDVYITRGGREFHWPTFNVADIAIVIGVLLMGVDMIGSSRRVGSHVHIEPRRRSDAESPSLPPAPAEAPPPATPPAA